MTAQRDLELVWAETGGESDPGSTKYSTGWVAEIPTFQNFNWAMGNTTRNILAQAEEGIYTWILGVSYKVGVTVLRSGIRYFCKVATSTQDPATDASNNNWMVGGMVLSATGNMNHSDNEGFVLDGMARKTTANLWSGSDLTVKGTSSLVFLETTTASKNLVFGNVSGNLIVADVEAQVTPDNRNLTPTVGNKSYKIYHENNKPTQADVSGTIPDAASDGKSYARKDANWVVVNTTTVSIAPPPPNTGAGAGWYNLDEGQFYVDVNDGDSSQWAPGNPPTIPIAAASTVTYDDSANGFGTDVQAALDMAIARIGRRSVIDNGDFNISQRGVLFIGGATALYTLDRWFANENGTGTVISISQESFTLGQTDVPGEPENFVRLNQTTAGTGATLNRLSQKIENVRTLAGKTVVISFWGRADVSRTVSTQLVQRMGTGGSPSSDSAASPVNHSFTTAWQKFEAVTTLSSLSGKTLGTDGNHNLEFIFNIPINVVQSIDISRVQVEEGSVVTSFEERTIAEEQALCERYLEDVKVRSHFKIAGLTNVGISYGFHTKKRDISSANFETLFDSNINLDTVSFGSSNDDTFVATSTTSVGDTNSRWLAEYRVDNEL